jgi:hypothetical protein
MNRLRTIHQKLSYQLGFARGLRGRPFKSPWWVDRTVYAIGYIDGQRVRVQDRLGIQGGRSGGAK